MSGDEWIDDDNVDFAPTNLGNHIGYEGFDDFQITPFLSCNNELLVASGVREEPSADLLIRNGEVLRRGMRNGKVLRRGMESPIDLILRILRVDPPYLKWLGRPEDRAADGQLPSPATLISSVRSCHRRQAPRTP